jgi:hypothetical protein
MSDDEINGLVAFFVFGYKWTDVPPDYDGNNAGKTLAPEGCKAGFPPRGKVSPRYFCKQWSTDLKLAWEVVEHVTGYVASNFALAKDNGCGAEFWNVSSTGEHRMGGRAHADSPARAICLAALNAVDKMRSKKCK